MFQRLKKILFVLCLTGCALSCQKQQPSRVDGRVYTNFQSNFSVTFPQGWRVDESRLLGSIVLFVDPNAQDEFSATITVFSEKTTQELGAYVAATRNQAQKYFTRYTVIAERTAAFGGNQGTVLAFSYVQGTTGALRSLSYFVRRNDEIFIITCTAREASFQSYAGVFEAAAASLAFN